MTEKTLSGKTALITGGARGIGRAVALKLAKHGANIAINYFNSSDAAENLLMELKDFGVKTYAVQGNVADEASVAEMMKQVTEYFPKLDIIVSNAASGVLKPVTKMALKHWRFCMETNAFALAALMKYAENHLNPDSSVIALTSMGSRRYIPDYGFIGASKAALESLVRTLSVELAEKKVRLNAVCAGAVDTDALKHFPARESLLASAAERSLAGRTLTPADVADTVYLLCLPEAYMIRGQTLIVDAGYEIIG